MHLQQLTGPRVPGGRADARPVGARRAARRRRRLGRPAAARGGPAGRRRRGRGAADPPARHRDHCARPGRRRPAGRRHRVQARWVVLAAGWQSAGIAGLPAGSAPPVRPVKGQILRLRPTPGRRGGRAAARAAAADGSRHRPRLQRLPGAAGQRRAGRRRDPGGAGLRTRRSPRAASGSCCATRGRWCPASPSWSWPRPSAGLRPGTPDNAPVIGPAELPGLVLATGHFRAGVLLAPVTADTVAPSWPPGRLIRAGAVRRRALRPPGPARWPRQRRPGQAARPVQAAAPAWRSSSTASRTGRRHLSLAQRSRC